jgi:autotransporter-associated beta strand protein
VVQNNFVNLIVDSITFSAGGGTSANGYTINGNPITINTAGAGQDPFGIDVATGVADPAAGITQIFNAAIVLNTADATFHTAEAKSLLTFHGAINLGGRTLTVDNSSGNANTDVQGNVIHGAISNGNLVKIGSGTLQLSGDNNYANTTVNNGAIVADSDTALGSSAGTLTANDPGRFQLRNGVTVVKTVLNLNSNVSGGGIGANGNTTNTFRGSVVLMAGNGGVAIGAGFQAANASTRLIIDGVISGATSTLFMNGAGVVEFTKNNNYTGITDINGNQGFTTVQIDSPAGLGVGGGAGNRTIIENGGVGGQRGGTVLLNFDGTLQNAGVGEAIDFAGAGVGGLGAIRALGDANVVISGNVTLIAAAPWNIGVDSGSLALTGVIDSLGAKRGLTKLGDGKLIIGGTAPNTYSGGTFVNAGTLSLQNTSTNPLGATPTALAPNSVTINSGGTLRVEAGVVIPNGVIPTSGGILAGAGTVGIVVSDDGVVRPGAAAGALTASDFTLDVNSTFQVDVGGQGLRVIGAIDLGEARLALEGSVTIALGAQVTLIENDGNDAITGTFAGLIEGARIAVGGQVFSLTYAGGPGGNDAILTAVAPLSDLAIAANKLSASYTDADGDLVTVKITKGALAASDFTFAFAADNRQQLQRLTLDAADAGANLTITSKRVGLGDGFANIGHLSALGVALGAVTLDGDLGRIESAAEKSLTVQSLGALGLTTQAFGGSLTSNITGNLGKLTVKGSIRDATVISSGSIGSVKLTGSFLGGRLSAGADLGTVNVRGDIAGTAAAPVVISAFGKAVAPTTGLDVALKSLTVSGGVEFLRVLAGYNTTLAGANADASIGAISVGKDWRSSSVLAGGKAGADGFTGTPDDAKLTGGTRDVADIFSSIASLTIKGQAFGTTVNGDTFGVVAEQIAKAKIGQTIFKFDSGERDAADAFAAAATGPGATGLTSDFFLREITN